MKPKMLHLEDENIGFKNKNSKDFPELTLNQIPSSKFTNFAKRIKRADGKVIIIVHPNWINLWQNKIYQESIKKAISNSKTPVIILEETHKMNRWNNIFKHLKSKRPLILPTIDSHRLLALEEKGKSIIYDKTGQNFLQMLEKMNAKNVWVGGMKTVVEPNRRVLEHERKILPTHVVPTDSTISRQCAGGLYRQLIESNKFEKVLILPNSVYPDKPTYVNARLSKAANKKFKLSNRKNTNKLRRR